VAEISRHYHPSKSSIERLPHDSLPHNGAVVTLLSICRSTHRKSYLHIVMAGIIGPDSCPDSGHHSGVNLRIVLISLGMRWRGSAARNTQVTVNAANELWHMLGPRGFHEIGSADNRHGALKTIGEWRELYPRPVAASMAAIKVGPCNGFNR
jgi:hypothetical protein